MITPKRPRSRLPAAGALLAAVFAVAEAGAEPPRVVRTVPGHGEIMVDPALAELRVEFDQPMSMAGYSWTGGGPTFPPLVGQPEWIDTHTCIARARLEPDRYYRFGINGGSYTNFRSVQGEPAQPHLVQFTTGPGPDGGAADDALTEGVNRESVAALRKIVAEHYSYRDRLGLDWDALFAEHEPDLRRARRPIDFAVRLSLLLERAEDTHIGVAAGDLWLQPHIAPSHANFNFEAVDRALTSIERPNDLVQHGRVDERIGYLRINSWDGTRREDLEAAVEMIRTAGALDAMIIDVRANGGGDELVARRVAGCFLPGPAVYSKHILCDPARPGGFSEMRDRIVHPTPGVPTFKGRIVVLIGPVVGSSNESFVAMLDQLASCTLIGMRTLGSSGNPRRHDLPNGVAVRLPSWQDFLADGTLLEGRGIEPDLAVETSPADVAQRDPAFERAVRFLQERE